MPKRCTLETLDAGSLDRVSGGITFPGLSFPPAPSNPRAWPSETGAGTFESVIGERQRLAGMAEADWQTAQENLTLSEQQSAAADFMSGTGIGDADAMRDSARLSGLIAEDAARGAAGFWSASQGEGPVIQESETEAIGGWPSDGEF